MAKAQTMNNFLLRPSEQVSYLPQYNRSVFSLPASPQYSTGEVCLASLMRSLGYGVAEREVYSVNSLEGSFVRETFNLRNVEFKSRYQFEDDIFNYLKSPFAGQSTKNPANYLNLYPIIPQFALVSNSAQFSGNPWNPGELVKGMIATGSSSFEEAVYVWQLLFEELGVSQDDDFLAKLLSDMYFFERSEHNTKYVWHCQPFEESLFDSYRLEPGYFEKYSFPAKAFTSTLKNLVALKKLTTRRQWVSMFESFLRVSLATHLIWICNLNIKLWNATFTALTKKESISLSRFLDNTLVSFESVQLDTDTGSMLRKISGDYGVARIGLNFILHYFSEKGTGVIPNSLSSFSATVDYINKNVKALDQEKVLGIKTTVLQLLAQNPNLQNGKSSFPKNIFEFLRHCLGQKNTNDSKERNFDQGYWAVKKGRFNNSAWRFKLGPVSILTVVALSIPERTGTATDVTTFLQAFGVHLNADKLLSYSLGQSLVDLGLTNDNPDGEKGIIILNPFYQSQL